MKIVDKSGKRVDGKASNKAIKKQLKETDPIIRNAEKGDIEELSPMDPPSGFDEERVIGVDYENFHESLKEFCDEHKEAHAVCERFEAALNDFKKGGYYITTEINDAFNEFFVAFDEEVMPHNRKEEKGLFIILQEKLLASGEHSVGDEKHTPVDLMEDEHIKMIQLASLTFNMLGLAMRLKDEVDIAMTFDLAYHKGMELVEMLKLHIFREDNTIFPLAQKLLTEEEFEKFYNGQHH
ncbi:MAG: hemerythrin domain-containing protein [Crocinitomicaceae bacterium]|nr:hemerythrin domain-containing protein [Crocinitomicaceae bacterium]